MSLGLGSLDPGAWSFGSVPHVSQAVQVWPVLVVCMQSAQDGYCLSDVGQAALLQASGVDIFSRMLSAGECGDVLAALQDSRFG